MLLSFFLSFSCLLWVALFNSACRDLPTSRALAIAQGRLDPISMCAFDELGRKEPSSPQHTLKEGKSTCSDHPSSHKLMQGDAWLGTDEELITLLATSELEPSHNPLPISGNLREVFTMTFLLPLFTFYSVLLRVFPYPSLNVVGTACTLPLNVRPDNGFLAHLASMSNIKVVVRPPFEEKQAPTCNSSLVILSPGKKRVLPPPSNNNPFKRGKRLDELFSLSSKALFNTEFDGKLCCREDPCTEKSIRVPHQAFHEAVQFSCIKHEAQISIVTGDSVDIKAGGNPSSIFMKVGNFQHPLRSESTTLAALHVLESEESLGDVDSSSGRAQVLIEAERAGDTQVSIQSKLKTPASLQADSFSIKPVKGHHTSDSKACIHLEPQLSMSPVYQDSVVQQNSSEVCTVSIPHCMLPTSALHRMKTGTDRPKTPIVTKQLRREVKAKKEIRSSSKQSIKVVMAACTPSLLKFFQRAPTL